MTLTPDARVHRQEQEIHIAAGAETAFAIVSDLAQWPRFLPATVLVEPLENDDEQRFRLWMTAKGQVRSWVSRIWFHPAEMRMTYLQEDLAPPLASETGEWRVEPLGPDRCRVVLSHEFTLADDTAESLKAIRGRMDSNSSEELLLLRDAAEQDELTGSAYIAFEKTALVRGPLQQAYDFVSRGEGWTGRTPHVAGVSSREEPDGVQFLTVRRCTPDGSVRTSESVRIRCPERKITYRELNVSGLVYSHTGDWLFHETANGLEVTARHRVVLNPAEVATLLGPEATIGDAARLIRTELTKESDVTVEGLKAQVEELPSGAGSPVGFSEVDPALYNTVLHFYAYQVQLLDSGEIERWVSTFTEEGVFEMSDREPWRGQADINARMRSGWDRIAADGVRRRHWLGMVVVEYADEQTVRTRYYASIVATPVGGAPSVTLSTLVEDVLVREGTGLKLHYRRVSHDNAG